MPQLESVITCPACAKASRETMPQDACQHAYICLGCQQLVNPLPGDCCVFCSYGDTPCPPMQSS